MVVVGSSSRCIVIAGVVQVDGCDGGIFGGGGGGRGGGGGFVVGVVGGVMDGSGGDGSGRGGCWWRCFLVVKVENGRSGKSGRC